MPKKKRYAKRNVNSLFERYKVVRLDSFDEFGVGDYTKQMNWIAEQLGISKEQAKRFEKRFLYGKRK